MQTSQQTISTMGTGKTTAQMKTKSTFTSAEWNFISIWRMATNNYPIFMSENVNTYSGGNGTETNPFKIKTVKDLQDLMATTLDWNQCFVLDNDIDFSGVNLTPIGNSSINYTGIFDANCHVLRNIDINVPSNDYVGLFGYIGTGGVVKNLGLENIKVIGKSVVGGLAGYNYEGSISSCYADGIVSGNTCVAGLIGGGYNSTITNCYSTGFVTGKEGVSGLVLDGSANISFCYCTNQIPTLAKNRHGLDFPSCFYDKYTSGYIPTIFYNTGSKKQLLK